MEAYVHFPVQHSFLKAFDLVIPDCNLVLLQVQIMDLTQKNGNDRNGYLENKVKPVSLKHTTPYSSKLTQVDIYDSSRYDTILLKEDLKNTS